MPLRLILAGAILAVPLPAALAEGPWPDPPETGARAVLPSGELLELEVADEPEERRRGMGGRPALPDDRGMLFVFWEDGVKGFHMKDCLVPLDLLWLDRSGRVLHVAPDLPPCPAEPAPCPVLEPRVAARYVLELRSGNAARLGLEPGSLILLDLESGRRR